MITCRYWQDCHLIAGGCCHHPESPFRKPSPGICKRCALRVEGEPMEPAPAQQKQFGLGRSELTDSIVLESSRGGPGYELKRLLATIGIHPKGCNCNSLAARMDREGPDWCDAHLDDIVGHMGVEAEKRAIPFISLAARMIVLRAIALARRDRPSIQES